jgi:hypothetical protein
MIFEAKSSFKETVNLLAYAFAGSNPAPTTTFHPSANPGTVFKVILQPTSERTDFSNPYRNRLDNV